MEFKEFLLNEETAYLSHKVSDVLTALHDLVADIDNLGSRQLNRMAEALVNQIRRILHSQWSDKQHKNLKAIQKAGVAIMKAIDEKGDLKIVLKGAAQELEELTGDLKKPVSDINMKGKPAKLKKAKKAPEEGQEMPQTGPPGEMPGQMPQPSFDPSMQQMPAQGAA